MANAAVVETEVEVEEESKNLADDLNKLVADFSLISDQGAQDIDHDVKAAIAKLSKGMSPLTFVSAYLDWLGHLAISPGKMTQLTQNFIRCTMQLGVFGVQSLVDKDAAGPMGITERRFKGDAWNQWPFKVLAQWHEMRKQWWHDATTGVDGVTKEHENLVSFMAQQVVELASPANFPLTNPEVIKATKEEKGANLKRGVGNLLRDARRQIRGGKVDGADAYAVGETVGITEGKVVYQNRLMELIQYKPATETVGAEPVLVIPPWIMKYYILDLSPKNSLVKYMVDQGKTVFMVSWKNPTEEDRETSFNDYLNLGFLEALDAVNAIVPKKKVNAVGYCIGGTLLTIGAALLAREHDDRLNSVSLFAAQSDFSEPGGISVFVGESQLEFLDKLMWKKGYLGDSNMGGAFGALRASDLIWGPAVDRYFLGKKGWMNDLMAWNADGTRMPHRMHSEYLRKLYLQNQLAEGKFEVEGKPILLADINVPLFVVATVTDHVAPWKSVYKITHLTNTELTFLLTSGGHNAGIISGPSHPRRSHQVAVRNNGDKYIDPESWIADTETQAGSWWPAWNEWLDGKITEQVKAPGMGAARKGYKVLRDAPGEYVLG